MHLVLAAVVVFGGAQPPGLGGGFKSLLQAEERPETPVASTRFPPVAWSPVRRELAFGGTVGGADHALPPGWLLPAPASSAAGEAVRRAIWVLPPGEAHAELVAASAGVLTAPCWAPDGDSLFFVRWEPARGGEGTLSLVRQHRDGKAEVVVGETGRFPYGDRLNLPYETAAASPDGLLLAVPWLSPKGLAVVSLETNRIVRRLHQASAPVWSADSQHLAYFTAEPATMAFLTTPKGPKQRNAARLVVASRTALLASPSSPASVGRSMGEFDGTQPVQWDRTGHTLLALRSLAEPPSSFEASQVQVLRVGAAEGRAARVVRAPSGDRDLKGPAFAASFAAEPRGDSLFLCAARTDGRMMIERFELSGSQSDAPWHPFDDVDSAFPAPLGAVALSADGKRLAFRFGKPELGAPVAVWDVEKDRTTPVHTDDAGDLRSAAVFAASARRTLLQIQPESSGQFQMTLPGSWDAGREHPQRLRAFPRQEQLVAMDDARKPPERQDGRLGRIRRLAAAGLAFLAERQDFRGEPPTRAAAAFDEIALQLHYLREEFDQARGRLDRLAADPAILPARRLMLAILRAQCLEATAGRTLARWSLEPLFEGDAERPPPARALDGAHPFTRRIEELLGRAASDRPADEESR